MSQYFKYLAIAEGSLFVQGLKWVTIISLQADNPLRNTIRETYDGLRFILQQTLIFSVTKNKNSWKWCLAPTELWSQHRVCLVLHEETGGCEEAYIHTKSVVSSPWCLKQPTSRVPSKSVPRRTDAVLRAKGGHTKYWFDLNFYYVYSLLFFYNENKWLTLPFLKRFFIYSISTTFFNLNL